MPLNEVLGSLVLGVMGGVLGSFFITVNGFMGRQRKKYATANWRKILETGCFGVATISTMTMVVGLAGVCKTVPPEPTDKE